MIAKLFPYYARTPPDPQKIPHLRQIRKRLRLFAFLALTVAAVHLIHESCFTVALMVPIAVGGMLALIRASLTSQKILRLIKDGAAAWTGVEDPLHPLDLLVMGLAFPFWLGFIIMIGQNQAPSPVVLLGAVLTAMLGMNTWMTTQLIMVWMKDHPKPTIQPGESPSFRGWPIILKQTEEPKG